MTILGGGVDFISELDLREGGRYATRIDDPLTVTFNRVFIVIVFYIFCPFVALLKATYADHLHNVIVLCCPK